MQKTTAPSSSLLSAEAKDFTGGSSSGGGNEELDIAASKSNDEKEQQQPKVGSQQKKNKQMSFPDEVEIPEHLKRKIDAKRPPLGHVVPKMSRSQLVEQEKQYQQQQNPDNQQRQQRRLRKNVPFQQGKPRNDGSSYSNMPKGMLKILAGTLKGKRLESPPVYLRPMMGKVREAVFSTFTYFALYEQDLCRHLDIFAGSGSVGLESLSRGASFCTFVDLSPDCCQTVINNLRLCQLGENDQPVMNANVICADYLSLLNDPDAFGIPPEITYQIVTLSPPYEEIVYADLLHAVANTRLVTDDTIILIEYPIELGTLPHVYTRDDGGKMIGIRNRRYGRTVIAMYIINPTGKLQTVDSRPEEFVSLFKK